MRLTFALLVTLLPAFSVSISAEELVLEDYASGGEFAPADWANAFEDADGNANAATVEKEVAVVKWATKWSGFPSTGDGIDTTRFKSYQVDVMVAEGQPVEDEANFYFQLTSHVDSGFAYWETFVPQNKVPADGKWHRITFPISKMEAQGGDGGDAPTDFKTINGCACGMTYDEGGSTFKFKEARFDNVTLLTDVVEEIKIEALPESDTKE